MAPDAFLALFTLCLSLYTPLSGAAGLTTMSIKSHLETHSVGWLDRQNQEGKLNKNISIRKHNDLQVLLQYLILRHRPETGFSGAEIMSFCDDLKNGEPELPVDELSTLLDYLDAALPEKRQYLKKAHIPVVLYVARNAMRKISGRLGLDYPFPFEISKPIALAPRRTSCLLFSISDSDLRRPQQAPTAHAGR